MCVCQALCARQDPKLVGVTRELDLHQIMLWFVCVLLKLNYWNPGTGRGVSTLLENLFAFMRHGGGLIKLTSLASRLHRNYPQYPILALCVWHT